MNNLRNQKFCLTLGMLLVFFIVLQLMYVLDADELKAPAIHHFVAPSLTMPDIYKAEFGDHSNVYDGDTWTDIYITIKNFENGEFPSEVLYPGIFLQGDSLYAVTDVRLSGVDTPEKRPLKVGRTAESIAKEKAAAEAAKELVLDILDKHDWKFVLSNLKGGKYYGRIVADILIGDDQINLSEYLVEKGYAYRYEGGKKKKFDDWYQH